MDAGCYCLSFVRAMAGVAPSRVLATSLLHPSGVDRSTMALLEFPTGLQAQISCSFETAFHRSATLTGANGMLEFSYPNSPFEGEKPTYMIRPKNKRSYAFDTKSLKAGGGFRLEFGGPRQHDQGQARRLRQSSARNPSTTPGLSPP